jgi:putative transposase
VGEYAAFEKLLITASQDARISLFSYCLMPNHWHLVLRPTGDRDLSRFMHDLTGTHAQQWNVRRNVTGQGAVYQGRFKAIPVQHDDYFIRLCRYVERNPLRAGLVSQAQAWRWSSLWRRLHYCDCDFLAEWPVARPEPWANLLDNLNANDETEAIRSAIRGNVPYGAKDWRAETATRFKLAAQERVRGRPKK